MATTEELAQLIWDFNNTQTPVTKSDCILVLGSNDLRVAQRGAELFLQGYAPLIIFSGNEGHLTQDIFDKPEAEIFADEALRMGVPKEAMLIENRSLNTGENMAFTKALTQEHGMDIESFIVVTKPYMQPRALATFKVYFPDEIVSITAPEYGLDDSADELCDKDTVIHRMIGDLQRLQIYPARGFSINVSIPQNVLDAYKELIQRGYTKRLVEEL